MATAARAGNFFEDFEVGMRLRHATPRSVHGGDLAMYIGATGDRRPLHSSSVFARSLGFEREVVHDLLVFHLVFGKTVADISLNAVANLGYADVRFVRPVYPGNTLHAESEVIGLRQTSGGKSGIVWVTTRGFNEMEQEVVRFHRWVLVHKRDPAAPTSTSVPELPAEVCAAELPVPDALKLERFSDVAWATGGQFLFEDYRVGDRIQHVDGMTIEEAEHSTMTRLYQNTAKVHFNGHQMASSRFGKRLIYGGHVISIAHALAMNGLENTLTMAAWNSGAHANPTFAGDTIYAFSDVLATESLPSRPELGALRLRLVAVKNVDPSAEEVAIRVVGQEGTEAYNPSVVLDLDYWTLIPRRSPAQSPVANGS